MLLSGRMSLSAPIYWCSSPISHLSSATYRPFAVRVPIRTAPGSCDGSCLCSHTSGPNVMNRFVSSCNLLMEIISVVNPSTRSASRSRPALPFALILHLLPLADVIVLCRTGVGSLLYLRLSFRKCPFAPESRSGGDDMGLGVVAGPLTCEFVFVFARADML